MSTSLDQSSTPAEWLTQHPAATAAERAAVSFLDTMERRDLVASQASIAPDFAMVFPGAARYTRLQDLVDGARRRYRWVAKRIVGVDASTSGDSSIVWVRGTLYGENVAGAAFAGIRFVDRFELRGGLLISQDVWNDLAESGVLDQQP